MVLSVPQYFLILNHTPFANKSQQAVVPAVVPGTSAVAALGTWYIGLCMSTGTYCPVKIFDL